MAHRLDVSDDDVVSQIGAIERTFTVQSESSPSAGRRLHNKRSRPAEESSDDADDYTILAVGHKDNARRYKLTVPYGRCAMTVDTGSPDTTHTASDPRCPLF